jgi:hypothetical protein
LLPLKQKSIFKTAAAASPCSGHEVQKGLAKAMPEDIIFNIIVFLGGFGVFCSKRREIMRKKHL